MCPGPPQGRGQSQSAVPSPVALTRPVQNAIRKTAARVRALPPLARRRTAVDCRARPRPRPRPRGGRRARSADARGAHCSTCCVTKAYEAYGLGRVPSSRVMLSLANAPRAWRAGPRRAERRLRRLARLPLGAPRCSLGRLWIWALCLVPCQYQACPMLLRVAAQSARAWSSKTPHAPCRRAAQRLALSLSFARKICAIIEETHAPCA